MKTDNYATKEESEALLAEGAKWKAQRLKQEDMLPVYGIDARSMIVVDDMYPDWQFLSNIHPTVKPVLDVFSGNSWMALNFYETPMGALNGKTPLHALIMHEATHERIIELAEASLY